MSHLDLRPQIRVGNRTVLASQANTAGTYTIHWLDNENRAKKIEFYADLSLYKILYTDLLLPLKLQVSEHQTNHPKVACECQSLRVKIAENSYKFDLSRFDEAGKLSTRTACIEDALGYLLTTTTFSADGAFVVRSNYHYDNSMTLESVQDYDSFGNLISA